MWCISAYEYVVGEAKIIKIFAVYLQPSGFPSQSSEYALECCLLSPVFEARSVLLEFAMSRKCSRSRRMRCRVGYYILCTSPSVGLRRGCGLSLNVRFLTQLALVAGFRRVSSLAFSLELSRVLYRCLIVDISVCNS